MQKYDLNALYADFESPEFQNDLKQLEDLLQNYREYVNDNCQDYEISR